MSTRTVDDDGQLLSPAKLADRWDVTRKHIYGLMARGLPSMKVGGARRIRVSDAEAWLADQNSGGRMSTPDNVS